MRAFKLRKHPTAKSIHEAAGHIKDRPSLRLIRQVGAWAFVSVPSDPDGVCIVNLWFRGRCRPDLVARVLGHELGHISDGGPKDDELGMIPEEERAEEFAETVVEVVRFLLDEGILMRRSTRRRTS